LPTVDEQSLLPRQCQPSPARVPRTEGESAKCTCNASWSDSLRKKELAVSAAASGAAAAAAGVVQRGFFWVEAERMKDTAYCFAGLFETFSMGFL
jgi:hypothetical protein